MLYVQLISVEASLRLDAVASGGIGLSRTKLASLISTGDVCVNGQVMKNTSATVKEGMKIEIKHVGIVYVDEITNTSKGKYKSV